MFIVNKTNEYNYVPNQVNIRIRIRIWDIRFASYPTTSESVSVSELKCDKKCYPDPIPYVSDSIPSLAPAQHQSQEQGNDKKRSSVPAPERFQEQGRVQFLIVISNSYNPI